jgi:hypothetical protein
MAKRAPAALVMALAMTGCVTHTWVPGLNQSAANFGQASGQCKLVAMGVERPTEAFASGNTRFVATYLGAVTVAGAIGNAVRENQAYNACMEAQGFVEADQATPTPVAATVPAATVPAATVPIASTTTPTAALPGPPTPGPAIGLPDHLTGESTGYQRTTVHPN